MAIHLLLIRIFCRLEHRRPIVAGTVTIYEIQVVQASTNTNSNNKKKMNEQ